MKGVILTAAFIATGLAEVERNNTIEKPLLDVWNKGHLELVRAATDYAPYGAALIKAGYEVTGGFPGVPDYEISEEFGRWFGEWVLDSGGDAPTHEQCLAQLRGLARQFFLQAHLTGDAQNTLIIALEVVPTTLTKEPS